MQQGPISTFSIAVGVVSVIMAMSSVLVMFFHTLSITLLILFGIMQQSLLAQIA